MPHDDLDSLPAMISTRELATFLRVSENLLMKWRSAGTGPPWVKVGGGTAGLVRYSRVDLRAYLAAQRRPAAAVTR